MFVQIEETPNPETLKFFPGKTVLQGGTLEVRKGLKSPSCDLARSLLELMAIKSILFSSNFIAVTKLPGFDWSHIKPEILFVIIDYYSRHNSVLLDQQVEDDCQQVGREMNERNNQESSLSQKIRDLLETHVRPAILQDGGDIRFSYFKDGIVYLELMGACSGCPSSVATLKMGIENMLRYYVPEVQEVKSV